MIDEYERKGKKLKQEYKRDALGIPEQVDNSRNFKKVKALEI